MRYVLSQWNCKNLHSCSKLDSYSNAKVFFIALLACAFPFHFWGQEHPIEGYQNAITRAMTLHELKKSFMLMTQDSVGRLKTLCVSVLSLSGGMESEWKRWSSSLSTEKTLSVRIWIQHKNFPEEEWLITAGLLSRDVQSSNFHTCIYFQPVLEAFSPDSHTFSGFFLQVSLPPCLKYFG